jgi:hypothetical protein
MAGRGSHWYHYRICFDERNRLKKILRVDKDGIHKVEERKVPVISRPDGYSNEFIKFEYDDYKCKENESFLEWYE